jgi:hypothetical protein
MSTTVNHYNVSFNGVKLDPYRLFTVYNITHPAQQHAIKKLLRAGRSNKTLVQDVQETIIALNRWLEMLDEESTLKKTKYPSTQAEALEKFEQERAAKAPQGRGPGRPRNGKHKSRRHRRTAAAGRAGESARESASEVVPTTVLGDQSRAAVGRRDQKTPAYQEDGTGNPG